MDAELLRIEEDLERIIADISNSKRKRESIKDEIRKITKEYENEIHDKREIKNKVQKIIEREKIKKRKVKALRTSYKNTPFAKSIPDLINDGTKSEWSVLIESLEESLKKAEKSIQKKQKSIEKKKKVLKVIENDIKEMNMEKERLLNLRSKLRSV